MTTTGLDGLREHVAALHAELTRYGLVAWTGGQRLGAGARAELMVIKPSGVSYDELTRRQHDRLRPGRAGGRGRLLAVQRHRGARLCLPGMPEVGGVVHTHSTVRHGLGGPGRGDPVRPHRAGRRVRRGDPDRAVRADRRRRHRQGHRRHPVRPPLTGGADAQPRGVHDRPRRPGRGQGRGHVRRRRPHRPPGPALGEPVPMAPADVDALYRPLPERLRPAAATGLGP